MRKKCVLDDIGFRFPMSFPFSRKAFKIAARTFTIPYSRRLSANRAREALENLKRERQVLKLQAPYSFESLKKAKLMKSECEKASLDAEWMGSDVLHFEITQLHDCRGRRRARKAFVEF